MDAAAFERACTRAAALAKGANGIGTLGEKSLHAALKFYFEPDESCHELPLGGFVADIIGEHGVIEIQTRNLRKLIRKLDAFLEACPVTVVHPLCCEKYVVWHEPCGNIASRRKSPAHAKLWHALPELYAVKYALDNPRFRLCLCMLTIEEHRCLDGYGTQKKSRATKLDRVPVKLHEEIWFESPSDYLRFLPQGLPVCFTSAEVADAGGMPVAYARILLNILTYLELLLPAGRQGNQKIYRLREQTYYIDD
ncbi:MAG: hypothetical protein IJY85_02765 [Ruminococcus sp.]|nr:hypothetical protein [Ruminococcus sp.]